jgi:PAS domain S-box-containing protein
MDPSLNETERLATLRALGLLESGADDALDSLTRTACRLFDVPYAVISLVDACRVWFKSNVGVPLSEMPRSGSFCDHLIAAGETLVVTDAHADDRFADLPMVTDGPHLRFYAGHVLRAHNGQPIGTLCVADATPRAFGAADLAALADLASAATALIQQRYEDLPRMEAERARRELALSLSTRTGEDFFERLVDGLTAVLGVDLALVLERDRIGQDRLGSVAVSHRDKHPHGRLLYPLPGSPCEAAMAQGTLVVPDGVSTIYPDIRDMAGRDMAAYVGVALHDVHGTPIGVLALLHGQPMADVAAASALLGLLRERVSAELQRWRADDALSRQTAYMQLIEVIAVVANGAMAVDEVVNFTLGRVCGVTGWPAGRYWVAEAAAERPGGATAMWYFERPDAFSDWPVAIADADGHGESCLVGRVAGSGQPELARLSEGGGPGWSEAMAAGLGWAVAFPVIVEGEVVGAFEFFAAEPTELEPMLLDVMGHIGAQLAQVIDRAGTQSALIESRRQLMQAQQIARLGSWEWDLVTDRLTWSDELYRLFGEDPHTFTPTLEALLERLHPADRPDTAVGFVSDGLPDQPDVSELRYRRADGSVLWLQTRHDIIRDEDGDPCVLYGTAQDVTDRKLAKDHLLERERELQEAQRLAHLGSWHQDLRAGQASWSDETFRLLGLTPGEIAPTFERFLAQVHPDDRHLLTLEGLSDENATFELEYRLTRADGQVRLIHATGRLVSDEQGPATIFGTMQDVTEQRLAEQIRRESEDQMRSIIASSHDGIILSDASGAILAWNPGAERMFGYDADEVIGQSVSLIMPQRFQGAHEGGMAAVGPEGPKYVSGRTMEVIGRRKDGREFPVELSMASWHVGDRRFYSGIARDITERRENERLRGEFISIVSHELRTPINTLFGALELLHDGRVGELPPRAVRMVEIAYNNTGRLKRLVNDMLDVQLLEWGRLPINLARADAADLMGEALDAMQDQAARLDVRLEGRPLAAPVLVDADRIVQALTNLLGNALKYTAPGGRVWLRAELTEDEVTLEVGDTGRGIPAEALDGIFDKYQQVAPGEAREKGGAGLGLAITRAIVERHHGRIWVQSTLGEGSRFSIALPLAAVDAPASP